jgi:hypothetical protein
LSNPFTDRKTEVQKSGFDYFFFFAKVTKLVFKSRCIPLYIPGSSTAPGCLPFCET